MVSKHLNPRRPKVFGTHTWYQGGGGVSKPPLPPPISRMAQNMNFKFGTFIVQLYLGCKSKKKIWICWLVRCHGNRMLRTTLLLFKFLQCQSKQEISQYIYSDASQKCHLSPYQTKTFRAYSQIPADSKYVIFNWFLNCGRDGQKDRAKTGKSTIPVFKEGIFLN